MSGLVLRSYRWLAIEPHQRRGARVLQLAIGLMLLFRVFTEGPFLKFLWGPRGVGSGSSRVILGSYIGGLLDRVFTTDFGTLIVVAGLGAGGLGLLLGVWTRSSTVLALLTFFMLEQRLPQLPDGGDNITRIVLAYMVFLLPPTASPKFGSFAVWLHNLAVLAIGIQICILYTISGLMKAYGDKWHHGIAMYYISQVEWFSHPAVRKIFKNPFVVTASTYMPMFYQLLFSMAILSQLKLPWLALGISFHLGVAWLMGLVTFSTVMIGLELFLITDSEYTDLAKSWRLILAKSRLSQRSVVPEASAEAVPFSDWNLSHRESEEE